MKGAILAARASILVPLALLLTLLLAQSSLTALLPFAMAGLPALLLAAALLLAFLPALLARESPLPAAAFVTVPALAAATYGASRLDWLRLLKDFGVYEVDPWSPLRLALGAIAVTLLLGLHVADFALRLRARAIERGIDTREASTAASRSAQRNGIALAVAVVGAAGLLAVALLGLRVGGMMSTERGAFIVPLAAAALLVGAALLLARPRRAA